MVVKVALVAVLLLVILLALPAVLRQLRRAKDTVVDNRHEIGPRAREIGATLRDQAETGAGRAREVGGAAWERGRAHGETLLDKGREHGQTAWAAGRGHAEAAGAKVGDLTASAAARAGLRTKGHGVYARTLLIGAPAQRVLATVQAGVDRAAVLDQATPRDGETSAWSYAGTGFARVALADDGQGRSVFGATEFEYVWGEPQGGPAVEEALDRVEQALVDSSVAVGTRTRSFTPGEDDTSDGMRRSPLL